MINSPARKLPPKISRSCSCKDLSLASKESRFSICSSLSFKSAEDLPAAVADCFQDSSFLCRLQNKLLIFFGRGSRYRVQPKVERSFSTLLSKKKPSTHHMDSSKESLPSSPQLGERMFKKGSYYSPMTRIKPKASSTPSQTKRPTKLAQKRKIKESESAASSTSNGPDITKETTEGDSTVREEEDIMRQYVSLQQLAIARRHCTQLRRIRDSLSSKARSRRPTILPSPVQEKLRNFLMDVGFVQYYVHLNRHGYDLPTASHMDVLDLAAVGISEPLHRMALKYELDQIRHPITPADEIPDNISDWLASLGLPEYIEHFQINSFYCPLAAIGLTKRDLHLMGIYMNGHRKKLVLALASLKASLLTNDFSKHQISR